MNVLTTQRDRLVLAAVGTLQGVIYYLLSEADPTTSMGRTALVTLGVFGTVAGLSLQYAWTGQERRRLTALALGLATLFAAVTWWVWSQMPLHSTAFAGDDFRAWTWIPAACIALYILLPFLQITQRTGRLAFPYSVLFHHSWNNAFIGLVATLFTGVFWLVLVLWAQLFALIGITFFVDFFYTTAFVCISLATVGGYGLAIGKENETIINTLRRITLAICHVFMPLLAAIALLFLLTLPVTGLQPLWNTKQASLLLLALLALTILFINTVFQDGTDSIPYPTWMGRGIDAALLAMPIWCVLAGMAMGLRIQQYGLTPERFYTVLLVGVASAYALGYGGAVLWQGSAWLSGIRYVNVPLAFGVALLALLLHTPLLDPLRWSARSQYTRLAEERTDAATFDYAFLRFKLGHVGAKTLAALEQLSQHPQAELIQQRLAAVRSLTGEWEAEASGLAALQADDFLHLGEAAQEPVPPDFLAFLNHALALHWRQTCKTSGQCALVAVNLDEDPESEYVVLVSDTPKDSTLLGYDHDTGHWRDIGMFHPIGTRQEYDALLAALRSTGATAILPRYRDLRIGEGVFSRQP